LPAISLTGDFVILNIIFVAGYFFITSRAQFLADKNILFYLYINLIWLILSVIFQSRHNGIVLQKKKMFFTYFKVVVFFFFLFLIYFQIVPMNYYPRDYVKYLFVILFITLVLWKLALYYAFVLYRKMGYNFRNVIIVGATKNTRELRDYFVGNPLSGYRFQGFIGKVKNLKSEIVGQWSDLSEIVESRNIDEIYIGWESVPKEAMSQITRVANQYPLKVRIVPDFGEFSYKNAELVNYDMVPVLQIHPGPLSYWYNRLIKRSFDIFFSILFIVGVLWWFTIILYLLSLIGSREGVFFRQKRTGIDGKIFICFKYRTMKNNAEADIIQTTKKDKRITPVGKFLRKTSLDELPQFINVLLGQMSVVGPRPHMLHHTSQYRKMVKRFMVRHTIKPGITGLAQIRGYRGEIRKSSDLKKRISFDVNYIETWNFGLDLKIILLTLKNVIKGDENAY